MAIRLPAGDQLPPFLSRLGAEAPLPSACWRQADGAWVVALANRREEKALVELGAISVSRPAGKPERENSGWLELVSMRQVPLPDPWNVPTLILLADAKEAALVARNIVSLGHDGARLGCMAGESGRWWVIHGNSLPVFVLVGLALNRPGSVMVDLIGKGAWFPRVFGIRWSVRFSPGQGDGCCAMPTGRGSRLRRHPSNRSKGKQHLKSGQSSP